MHWWQVGGDASALQVIIDEFTRRGGLWSNVAQDSYVNTRASVVERMAKGYPPTAVQWNAGLETQQFAALGLLNSVEDAAQSQQIVDQFHPDVQRLISVNDQLHSIPVNIHSESWLWISRSLTEQISDAPASSWTQLLELAESLSQRDQVTFAVGDQYWQLRILFNSVLSGVAGKQFYEGIYRNLDSQLVSDGKFAEVVRVFQAMRAHAKTFGDGSWQQQVQAVAEDRAAMLFMGDWAKGEFSQHNRHQQNGLLCLQPPGTENFILPVVDVFMLGRVSDPLDIIAQRLLIETLMDRGTLNRFNQLKGSISPFRSQHDAVLDACSQQVADTLSREKAFVIPFAQAGDGEFASAIQNAIGAIWQADAEQTPAAIKQFHFALQNENKRRNSQSGIQFAAGTD